MKPQTAFAALLSLLLAGCAYGAGSGSAVTAPAGPAVSYSPSMVRFALQDGEFATEIYGRPFRNAAPSNEEIAAAMPSPAFFPPARLTTVPSTDGDMGRNNHYRLVFAFNPTGGLKPRNVLCRAPGSLSYDMPGDTLRFQAVFCGGEEALASSFTRLPMPRDHKDPAFRNAVDQALYSMLPPRDPKLDDPDDRLPFGILSGS